MLFLIKTSNNRLILLIVFYLIYLFFGALVFDSLESPHEARVIKELNQYVEKFRNRHNECISSASLNEFIKLVSMANDRGVPALRNVSKEPNWSFGQAVFFSGTILTTIGYGDVYPQTQLGKVFCMIFAIFGIPVTLLLLYAIIERLMIKTTKAMEIFTEKSQYLLNRLSIFRHEIQRSHMHVLFAFICTLIVFIIFFIIPAGIYSHIEDWSYLNAFYYCFISLSTVGLGDYVPGDSEIQQNRHTYKIFSTMYLIIGVLVMVWLLQIYSETPEFNLYKYFTLTKDGILTHHIDTVHTASSMTNIAASYSTENRPGSAFGYEKHKDNFRSDSYDAINSPKTTEKSSNDSELILNNLNSSTNQNYLSLSSVNPKIQE
ncbi:unnamed protein product [Brachionus calyciflorus]|uniref:Potassium channel domain-containing protein n=1 Tax=Brachionus calyciflorus TaxID=104777 RepID=A0A813SA80_9BILA|nr:unnamed protein product [Brachionus calyciflorus]